MTTRMHMTVTNIWRHRHVVGVLVAVVVLSCVFGATVAMAQPMHDGPSYSEDMSVAAICQTALPGSVDQAPLVLPGTTASTPVAHFGAPLLLALDSLSAPPPALDHLSQAAPSPLRI